MRVTKKIEAEVKQFMQTYWDTYLKGDIKKWAAFIPNDYKNIGTNQEEIWNSKKDIIEYTKAVTDQMVGVSELRNKQTQIIPYAPYLMVHELGDMYIKVGREWTFYGSLRLSSLIQKNKTRWQVLHQHGSFPDSKTQEGEAFAFDALKAENQKLQKAVKRRTIELEEKNRELEIETALERVRSRSMAMQKSEELKEVIQVVYDQFVQLKINVEHTGFIIDYKTRDDMHIWLADQHKIPAEVSIPYFDSPHWNSFIEATKKHKRFFTNQLSFKEKNKFYRSLFKLIPGVSEKAIQYYLSCPGLAISTVLLDNVGLYIENFSGTPYTDEENNTLIRFGKVFQQTYTRFLDLQKAEAQVREAQIEAGLERVRSRSLAMHNTSELQEVIHTVHKELLHLNISVNGGSFITINKDIKSVLRCWGSGGTADTSEEVHLPLYEKPFCTNIINRIKKAPGFFTEEYTQQEKKDFFTFFFKHETWSKLSCKQKKDTLSSLGGYTRSFFLSQHSSIFIINHFGQKFSTAENEILQRFGKVFEQAYTRFLDIQKAEAQAREARIEAALERSRTQSMLMQHSSELDEISKVFHEQLLGLGIDSEFSFVWLPDEEKDEHLFWATWQTEKEGKTEVQSKSIAYPMDLTEPTTLACMDDWKSGVSVHEHFIPPLEIQNFFVTWEELLEGAEKLKPEYFPDGIYYTEAFMKYGCFGIDIRRPLSEKEKSILNRFAIEFERAYTRFLDLQKAEAQAREAEVELALERVRARTMAMQHSDELADASFLLDSQVRALGIRTRGCAFHIYGETDSTEWFSSEHGTMPVYRTPHENIFLEYYEAGQRGESIYVKEFKGKACAKHYDYLCTIPVLGDALKELIKNGSSFPKQQIDHAAFFKYGFLLFITLDSVPEAHDIFKRFAKVFEQTYTRFLDLQKAEAQARESEIQLALERVRARTMAMHNSQDVSATAITLFDEVSKLGLDNAIRCGIGIIEGNDLMETWSVNSLSNGEVDLRMGMLDMSIHPLLKKIKNSWKKGNANYTDQLSGKEVLGYYKALNNAPEYPFNANLNSLPEKEFHNSFAFREGVIFAFSTNPMSAEATKVFERFAHVFGQTYRRYLDLKKAEAQAREAQIEAALERVRARSMAMHKSEELLEVITVVSEQLQQLNFKFDSVSFANNNQAHDYTFWFSAIGQPHPHQIHVPYIDNPMFERVKEIQKNGNEFYSDILTKNENQQWIQHLLDHNEASFFSEETIAYLLNSGYARSIAFTPNIMLIVGNYASRPYSEEQNKIISRFARVFEQSYTRFLDLQRAEAQVREAQIEAALERVRSKAMAMHSSQDLADTIGAFYKELEIFHLVPRRCGVGLLNKDSREGEVYTWNTTENGESLELVGRIRMEGHPVLENVYTNWLTQTDYHPILKGNEIKEYYKVIRPQMAFPDYNHDEVHYGYFLMFEEGGVYAWKETQLKEDELKIYKRFTSVLSLTYKRYKDLMDAEARALVAVREASLDRVRGEIASMRTSEDLKRITPLLWRELLALGVPFFRCGLMIVNEVTDHVQFYLSTPDGKPLAALDLPTDDFDITRNGVEHWRLQKVFTVHWDQEQFMAFTKSLLELGQVKEPQTYQGGEDPPESLTLQFVPFPQGMLYVGSEGPLSATQIDLVQALADAFSTAYARYEDFTNLEAAKAQIEKALSDLQETQKQLIQSEKMASLGELTAGIAHEIQNPLNFVNNFSEVSSELIDEMKAELATGNWQPATEIADDVKSNLEKILHHGKRADAIVKGMLQHSKSSSGKKEATDINVLCDEYLRLAYHGLRAKDKSFNAKFETDFDPSLEKINVVPQDIGRVMLNLITNAFYACTERSRSTKTLRQAPRKNRDGQGDSHYEPTVVVSTKKEGNSVLISVEDNGNGIPDSIKEKIFQPFFTTKPTGQGTGLGLSLSYDIVKAHGGQLRVETKEGEGSKFIIELQV